MKRKLENLKEEGKLKYISKDDHNYIMRQIVMSYMFRVVRIVIIIFSISYFIAILWYIFCWLSDDGVTKKDFFGFY